MKRVKKLLFGLGAIALVPTIPLSFVSCKEDKEITQLEFRDNIFYLNERDETLDYEMTIRDEEYNEIEMIVFNKDIFVDSLVKSLVLINEKNEIAERDNDEESKEAIKIAKERLNKLENIFPEEIIIKDKFIVDPSEKDYLDLNELFKNFLFDKIDDENKEITKIQNKIKEIYSKKLPNGKYKITKLKRFGFTSKDAETIYQKMKTQKINENIEWEIAILISRRAQRTKEINISKIKNNIYEVN